VIIKVVNSSGDERVISDIAEYEVARSESDDLTLTLGRRQTIGVGVGEVAYVMSDTGKTIDVYKGKQADGKRNGND
jgi:hypothetical protein